MTEWGSEPWIFRSTVRMESSAAWDCAAGQNQTQSGLFCGSWAVPEAGSSSPFVYICPFLGPYCFFVSRSCSIVRLHTQTFCIYTCMCVSFFFNKKVSVQCCILVLLCKVTCFDISPVHDHNPNFMEIGSSLIYYSSLIQKQYLFWPLGFSFFGIGVYIKVDHILILSMTWVCCQKTTCYQTIFKWFK